MRTPVSTNLSRRIGGLLTIKETTIPREVALEKRVRAITGIAVKESMIVATVTKDVIVASTAVNRTETLLAPKVGAPRMEPAMSGDGVSTI